MGLVFSLHASSKKECALWFSYFFVQTCFRIDKHTHLSSSCVYGNRLHFTVNMVLCILVYIYIYVLQSYSAWRFIGFLFSKLLRK